MNLINVKSLIDDNLDYMITSIGKKISKEKEWVQRFHDIGKDARADFIKKFIKKYDSDRYVNKELYHFHREPIQMVFFELLEPYAKEFGTYPKNYKNEDFLTEHLIIDDTFELKRYDGQGSFIIVNELKK